MYFRRFSVALLSSLVGYGAWYTYKGNSLDQTFGRALTTSSTQSASDAVPTRNVLVVGPDELHTGTFVGEGPISKNMHGGRNVLEMLTPEQATEKLRQNEVSFMVNRGQGVMRYDIVQLPSNNPIEDDHAEKIVQYPSPLDKTMSDWMFWGVFDGHAYVSST
jgi:pyruvate dehydrogenase phosphatase